MVLFLRAESGPSEENALLQMQFVDSAPDFRSVGPYYDKDPYNPGEVAFGDQMLPGQFPLPWNLPTGHPVQMARCTKLEDQHGMPETGVSTARTMWYAAMHAVMSKVKGEVRRRDGGASALVQAACDTNPHACEFEGNPNSPCQRCIDRSDPGVYKDFKKTWESVPSGFHPVSKADQAEWDTFNTEVTQWWGAGHYCCRGLDSHDLTLQPLCGICLRYHGGGLGGIWGLDEPCAASYCKPDGFTHGYDAIDDAYMTDLAAKCGPLVDIKGPGKYVKGGAHSGKKAVGNEGPDEMGRGSTFPVGMKETDHDYPIGYLAVVANNPRKKDLSVMFQMNKVALVGGLQGKITGTGSSSSQCQTELDAPMKGSASTTSGPFGGDVQCGGILAADYLRVKAGKRRTIEGLIFLNDEREPHRLDIIALKHQLEWLGKEQGLHYSLHEDGHYTNREKPDAVIDHVAR